MASVEAAVGSVECVKSADVASYDGLTVEYYTDHTTTDEIVAAIESVNGGQFTVTCLQPS